MTIGERRIVERLPASSVFRCEVLVFFLIPTCSSLLVAIRVVCRLSIASVGRGCLLSFQKSAAFSSPFSVLFIKTVIRINIGATKLAGRSIMYRRSGKKFSYWYISQ